MDKGKICKLRDIYRGITELDNSFIREFGVNINEAMAMCVLLNKERLTATEIVEGLGASKSNASKIIRAIEEKGFIERQVGEIDHRQMLFNLTKEGKKKIESMQACDMTLPDILKDVL